MGQELWTKLSISIEPDHISITSEDGPFSEVLVHLFRSHLDRAGIVLSEGDFKDFEVGVRAAGLELQRSWESHLNAHRERDDG